jgi:hypothetical protein
VINIIFDEKCKFCSSPFYCFLHPFVNSALLAAYRLNGLQNRFGCFWTQRNLLNQRSERFADTYTYEENVLKHLLHTICTSFLSVYRIFSFELRYITCSSLYHLSHVHYTIP